MALCALMISGFVSGSEIAFFSLTPQQCDELDETPRGQNVLAMIGKPERLLATILIANNLVNVTIVILCNYALGPVLGHGRMDEFSASDGHPDVPDIAFRGDTAQTDSQFRQYALDTFRSRRCEAYDGGIQSYIIAARKGVDDRQPCGGEKGERRDCRGIVSGS